jgi:serine/threonine protein kinase
MHNEGIVHRDIKAENIFLTDDFRKVKIADFGSSRDLFNPAVRGSGNSSSLRRKPMEHYVGTPNFISPEAVDNRENDCASDVWSIGCLVYQIASGIPPFVAGSEYLIYLRVKARDLVFPPGIDPGTVSLIDRLVQIDRSTRPASAGSILTAFPTFWSDAPTDLPEFTVDEIDCRRIAQSGGDPTLITNESLRDRVDTVRDWETRSAPGSGTDIVSHLIGNGSPIYSTADSSETNSSIE